MLCSSVPTTGPFVRWRVQGRAPGRGPRQRPRRPLPVPLPEVRSMHVPIFPWDSWTDPSPGMFELPIPWRCGSPVPHRRGRSAPRVHMRSRCRVRLSHPSPMLSLHQRKLAPWLPGPLRCQSAFVHILSILLSNLWGSIALPAGSTMVWSCSYLYLPAKHWSQAHLLAPANRTGVPTTLLLAKAYWRGYMCSYAWRWILPQLFARGREWWPSLRGNWRDGMRRGRRCSCWLVLALCRYSKHTGYIPSTDYPPGLLVSIHVRPPIRTIDVTYRTPNRTGVATHAPEMRGNKKLELSVPSRMLTASNLEGAILMCTVFASHSSTRPPVLIVYRLADKGQMSFMLAPSLAPSRSRLRSQLRHSLRGHPVLPDTA